MKQNKIQDNITMFHNNFIIAACFSFLARFFFFTTQVTTKHNDYFMGVCRHMCMLSIL